MSPAHRPEDIAKELARMQGRLQGEHTAESAPRFRSMGFFEAVLHHAGKPVAVLQGSHHVFANPPYAALVGHSKEELAQISLGELLDPTATGALEQTLAEVLRTGGEAGLRARLRTDAPGTPERNWAFQAFAQGGTPYVRVEALERHLLEKATIPTPLASQAFALALTLPDNRLGEVSPRMVSLLETPATVLGRLAWGDLLPPEDLPKLCAALEQGRRMGHAGCDARVRRGDGTWLDAHLEVLPWVGGTEGGSESVLVLLQPQEDRNPEANDTDAGFQHVIRSMTEAYALHEIILDAKGRPVDYRFLEANPAWEAFTGLRTEEVLGRTIREVQPEIEGYWIERLGHVALTGVPTRYEQYSPTVGKHFRVTAQCPRPGYFTILAVDITQERRWEERLALLSRAVEQSPTSIVITNAEGAIEYINPKVSEVTGYGPEEILGQNPRILKSGLQGPEVYTQLWDTLQKGRTWQGELCNRRKDGSLFWERAAISPVLDGGRVTHYLAVKEDITREKALEAARESLFTALEHTSEAVAIVNDDGAIIMANRSSRTLLGCPSGTCPCQLQRAEDCPLLGFLQNQAQEPWTAFLEDRLGHHGSWNGRLSLVPPGGGPRLLSCSFTAVQGACGRGKEIFCTIRDITEEEALERHLRQNEKMNAIGKLASGIAHDFNNVLTTILAAVELMEWDFPEGCAGNSKLEAIRLSARRAQALNQRLLTFARRGEDRRIPFDLSGVVKEVVFLLKSTVPENVELATEVSSSIWCLGDPNQVLQVVMNLAMNGFHAMRERGGKLGIRLAEADLADPELPAGLQPGRYGVLEVEDQGCGIPAANLSHVFEPFFTTKPVGEGTGLGLFVVHGIVTSHKGDIRITSEPGRGTRVSVILPCSGAPHQSLDEPLAADPTGTEQVLLVGGEELWAALMSEGLRVLGYKVAMRLDPFEALDQIRANASLYEAALVSQRLKGMALTTFLRRLKQEHPHLPVLLLAEPSASPEAEEGNAALYDDVVLLPATPKDLARMLRRTLEAMEIHALAQPGQAIAEASGERPPLPSILLAEDSATTRGLLRTWLAKAGYAVLEAKDGQEAWERFMEEGADAFVAVLTDLVMPRLDGLQLVERIRETDAQVPIVLLSSMDDADSLKTALQLQATEFLTKPFSSHALLECVQRVVGDGGARKAARRSMETVQAVRMAQQTLIPVPEPDIPVFSIAQPLTDAGGDVLRCLRQEDGTILFVLADIAGHSVLSSYAVASFLGMLSTFSNSQEPLPELARHLNRSVQDGPFREIPVCALLGRWDPALGRLHVLNAGIPYGLLLRRATGTATPMVVNGTPLGIFEEPIVEERIVWLQGGDRLFFATDGLFDLHSETHAPFGDVATGIWAGLAGSPIDKALAGVCERARVHAQGHMEDDILAMAFEQPTPERRGDLSLWLPSTLGAIDHACVQLREYLMARDAEHLLNASRRFDLIVAARELLANAITHGNRARPEAEVHMRCAFDLSARRIEMLVADEGSGFDLARHQAPDDPLSERGRGLPFLGTIGARLAMEGGEIRMTYSMEE